MFVVGSGNHEDESRTLDQLWLLYGELDFIIYAITIVVSLTAMYWLITYLEPQKKVLIRFFLKKTSDIS